LNIDVRTYEDEEAKCGRMNKEGFKRSNEVFSVIDEK
jgi:hypothetical protein